MRLYRKDLTIVVSIDQQNCDRLYSQIEPLDLLSKGVKNGTVAQFLGRSI